MTETDWVIAVAAALSALAAWVALGFSIYNAYARWRDRKPRVDMSTYWVHPSDTAMAIRGTANPTAPPGKAIYRCEITNVGSAGVKIRQVTVYPQAAPGRPLPLHLPEGEQPRKLDNGDSQTWSICTDATVEPIYPPDPNVPVHVIAIDTVGNYYEAKDPAPFPYPYSGYSGLR